MCVVFISRHTSASAHAFLRNRWSILSSLLSFLVSFPVSFPGFLPGAPGDGPILKKFSLAVARLPPNCPATHPAVRWMYYAQALPQSSPAPDDLRAARRTGRL